MLLDTVFLDTMYRHSLEKIAIEEGWITEFFDEECLLEGAELRAREWKNDLRSKTLLLATLCESMDSNGSPFDLSRLVDEGLIRQGAMMHDRNAPYRHFLSDEERQILDCARETAYSLMASFKDRIIRYHLARFRNNYDLSTPAKLRTTMSRFNLVFDQALRHRDGAEIDWPTMQELFYDMEIIESDLQSGILVSAEGACSFASAFSESSARNSNPVKVLDDVYCIARTKLTDEVLVLPHPQTLGEALAMREAKEMRRFREVLQGWCTALREGEPLAEQRMRKDVRKANKELTRLRSWREYEDSPINFLLNSVGGQVPILSNILTLVATVTGLWRFHVERKHNWVMLGDIRPAGRSKR